METKKCHTVHNQTVEVFRTSGLFIIEVVGSKAYLTSIGGAELQRIPLDNVPSGVQSEVANYKPLQPIGPTV